MYRELPGPTTQRRFSRPVTITIWHRGRRRPRQTSVSVSFTFHSSRRHRRRRSVSRLLYLIE